MVYPCSTLETDLCIHFCWKKGQQRSEQMAEIPKIVTSAGWLDQCPDGPSSMDFTEIEPEELPPSQWDAAVQEKHQ